MRKKKGVKAAKDATEVAGDCRLARSQPGWVRRPPLRTLDPVLRQVSAKTAPSKTWNRHPPHGRMKTREKTHRGSMCSVNIHTHTHTL